MGIGKITKVFLLVKAIQLIIVYLTPVKFDTSSEILIQKYADSNEEFLQAFYFKSVIQDILDKFVTWDLVHFSELFVEEAKLEHQFVWGQNWLGLIKHLPFWKGNFYGKLMLSFLVSNICHYLTAILGWQLTRQYFVLKKLTKVDLIDKFSETTSILMVISTGGIFQTVGYSENLSNLLSLLTIWLHNYSLNYNDFKQGNNKSVQYIFAYLLSGSFLAYNFTIRANAILLGAIYLFDLYEFLILNQNIKDSVLSFLAGFQLALSFAIANFYNYQKFCPQRGEWCTNRLPLLFLYAQSKYWSVGFLSYWSPNNIPNFLFALPLILIQLNAIRYYTIELPKFKKINSLIIVNCLLVLGSVFFWNVQILTRVGTFMPLSYWYTSELLIRENKWGKIIVTYMLIWIFLQASLFAAFLPPA